MASGFPDWLRAVQMLGKYGDVFTTVAVTEAGNLFVLLQGETIEEELRTVRLDDEGRLSAFIIDSTDAWGQMLTVGNAELAARLGTPVFFHQSGRVLMMEAWEHGLARWYTGVSGFLADVSISPVSFESRGYSVRLRSGSTDGWGAEIWMYTGVVAQGRMGLALSFARQHVFKNLWINMMVRDGTYLYHAGVRFNDTTDKVEVETGEGVFEAVADLELLELGANRYNHVKFIVNLDTRYYDKVYVNQESIDASAKQCYRTESGLTPLVRPYIELIGDDEENDVVYIDNIILTIAEP